MEMILNKEKREFYFSFQGAEEKDKIDLALSIIQKYIKCKAYAVAYDKIANAMVIRLLW